jgi:hypothetical protein
MNNPASQSEQQRKQQEQGLASRSPSLYEIFNGKLASQVRRVAQWRRRGGGGGKAREVRRRKAMRFEAVEPRILLTGDLVLASLAADASLQLNLTEADDTVLVRQTGIAADSGVIVDLSMAGVIQTYGDAGVGVRSISADGLGGNDSFRFRDVSVRTQVRGGKGNDSLLGPDGGTEWNITGPDQGTVGAVSFNGIENLSGEAGHEDAFILGAAGAVSGLVCGRWIGRACLRIVLTRSIMLARRLSRRIESTTRPSESFKGEAFAVGSVMARLRWPHDMATARSVEPVAGDEQRAPCLGCAAHRRPDPRAGYKAEPARPSLSHSDCIRRSARNRQSMASRPSLLSWLSLRSATRSPTTITKTGLARML